MRSTLEKSAKFFRLLLRKQTPYPEEIQIEVTNACNLTCAMCPHSFGGIPQDDLSFALFQEIVQANPAPRRLVLTGWGEPLLHPDLFSMIDLVHQHWPQTRVRFTSNGILLNETCREQLRQHHVDQITISIDLWPDRNVQPELQRFLHPSTPKTIENIRAYCQDATLRQQTPLVLQCLLLEENVEDVKKLVLFAAEVGIHAVNLVRLQVYPGLPLNRPAWTTEQDLIHSLVQLGKTCHVEVRSINQPGLFVRIATGFDRVCPKTDDSLYILLDGTVTPCCNLRNYAIGKLETGTVNIKEVWQSAQEQDFFTHQKNLCGKCDALFYKYR